MKKQILVGILFIFSLSTLVGQTSSDSITMMKVFGGYQFYQNGKRLNINQLVNSMELNEQAYKKINKVKSNYMLATVLGGAGGFMVGWQLGTALGGGQPVWAMAGVGAGLIVVSIPIGQKFNRQAKSAVDTFNGGLPSGMINNRTELKFAFTGNGIGLKLKF